MQRTAIALVLALALPAQAQLPPGHELALASEGIEGPADIWSVWDGHLDVAWNHHLLGDLGITVSTSDGSLGKRHGYERFSVGQTALRFAVRRGAFDGFADGELLVRGGFQVEVGGRSLDLRAFRLRPRADNPFVLDLVAADGSVWFYIDRLMYAIEDNAPTLAIRAMDVRVAPALAALTGQDWAADRVVGGMRLESTIHRGNYVAKGSCPSSSKWPGNAVPGVPGAVFEADVFMSYFNMDYTRRTPDADGPGGSDGGVVFTPSSTLRNNVNHGSFQVTTSDTGNLVPIGTSAALYAADVPWRNKFTANCPPYDNDQHPYLIWNLYRIDADGRITQVGRSGVKHAFLTINTGCSEHPGSGHILGRGCSDTYGTFNNDSGDDLGPRSELIPATGEWGRCGSIYDPLVGDPPACSGNDNNFSGYTAFDHRLVARESDIDPAANPGATWMFESWYLVRDDIDIYNTMQTRRASFSWTGSAWPVNDSPAGGAQQRLGPAIDRWVEPSAPGATASTSELDSPDGHAKVAVRATEVGGGRWRYDIAVMNFDFAIADTTGRGNDMQVLSNDGFVALALPIAPGLDVQDLWFSDGDGDGGNDWTASVGGGELRWDAPAGNPLNWGTLYSFSFTANAAPEAGSVALDTAQPDPRTESVDALVPQGGAVTGFSIGGTASGLDDGASATLQLNGAESLVVDANGAFVFNTLLDDGEAFAVTLQSSSQEHGCQVFGGSGQVDDGNVASIELVCRGEPFHDGFE